MTIRTSERATRKVHDALHSVCRNVFRRFLVLGAGLLMVSLPGMAFAQDVEDDDPFDRSGFYMGVGGSYQKNYFEGPLEDAVADELEGGAVSNVSLDLDDSGGLHAVAGYRVFSFVALELEYEWVNEYDVDAAATITPPGQRVSGGLYSIEGHSLTANMKLIVPFWRTQPYLKLGGGFAVSDVERGSAYDNPLLSGFLISNGVTVDEGRTTNPAGRLGVGMDIYITENILLNAEGGVLVTTLKKPEADDVEDLNYMSFRAGLQYRF